MSSYLDRYNHYLSPTRDYLTYGIFDDNPVERRRAPPPRPRTVLRDESEPPPFYLCPCMMDSKRTPEAQEEEPTPIFVNSYRKPLCTPEDLLKIIRKPAGHYQLPCEPCSQVYPNIYISDALTAMTESLLKRMRITHILNGAQGREKNCGFVNTTESFYAHLGMQFLGVPAFDDITFRIHRYFEDAADFIEEALKSGGRVLVHCQSGISISATLVCAYLMIKERLIVQDALKIIRKERAIIPNKGFLQQLCDLNDKLKRTPNYY